MVAWLAVQKIKCECKTQKKFFVFAFLPSTVIDGLTLLLLYSSDTELSEASIDSHWQFHAPETRWCCAPSHSC